MAINNHSILCASLQGHTGGYKLSSRDILLSIGMGFSGAPYAIRHFQLAEEGKCWFGHRVLALVNSIAIIGGLFGLLERVAMGVFERMRKQHSQRQERPTSKREDFAAGRISPLPAPRGVFRRDLPVSPSCSTWKPRMLPWEQAVKKMRINARKAIWEHRVKSKRAYASAKEGVPKLQHFKQWISQNQFRFTGSFASEKGRRKVMEDVCFFDLNFHLGPLVAVFDGHKHPSEKGDGSVVAQYLKQHLPQMLKQQIGLANVHQAFEAIIDLVNQQILSRPEWSRIGSTAVLSWLMKDSGVIYTATVGDSQATICRRIKGKLRFIPLSCERNWGTKNDWARFKRVHPEPTPADDIYHRLDMPKRIRHKGLNISRSLGDLFYRETSETPGVIHKPKITMNQLQPGDIVFLFSDAFENTHELEILETIEENLNQENLAQALVDSINKRGRRTNISRDNITAVIVRVSSALDRAGTPELKIQEQKQ